MSKADQTTEIPEAVVVSPDTESVHRQGDGLEPACAARLHHVDDDTEWRLTQEPLTDPTDRCGHPECFQDEQPVTDGGEEIDIVVRRSDFDSMAMFVDAIAKQVQVPERLASDARGIAESGVEWHAPYHNEDEIGAAAVYLAGLLNDEEISQQEVADVTDVDRQQLRETYLTLGNDSQVLPNWYVDTSEPEETEESDDSQSSGLIESVKNLFRTTEENHERD